MSASTSVAQVFYQKQGFVFPMPNRGSQKNSIERTRALKSSVRTARGFGVAVDDFRAGLILWESNRLADGIGCIFQTSSRAFMNWTKSSLKSDSRHENRRRMSLPQRRRKAIGRFALPLYCLSIP